MVAKSPGRVQASQGRKPATPVVHGAGCGGPAAAHLTVKVLSLLHLGRNARGAHSLDCSMSCANRHAVTLSRTLRQLSDLFVLFCRPTAAHLAPFILPSLGRRSASHRPCAILRQTSIGQKTDQALRQQIPRKFVAVDTPNLW
jgi:hypothetical protein